MNFSNIKEFNNHLNEGQYINNLFNPKIVKNKNIPKISYDDRFANLLNFHNTNEYIFQNPINKGMFYDENNKSSYDNDLPMMQSGKYNTNNKYYIKPTQTNLQYKNHIPKVQYNQRQYFIQNKILTNNELENNNVLTNLHTYRNYNQINKKISLGNKYIKQPFMNSSQFMRNIDVENELLCEPPVIRDSKFKTYGMTNPFDNQFYYIDPNIQNHDYGNFLYPQSTRIYNNSEKIPKIREIMP